MDRHGEFAFGSTLSRACEFILKTAPTADNPVVLLAAYIHSLTEGYGLSESQHLDPSSLERPELPISASAFLSRFLNTSDDDVLRDQLSDVFQALAADAELRASLNHNALPSHRGFLLVAQVGWNLERTERRRHLPLTRTADADISVPNTQLDFARMSWTKRSNQSGVADKAAGDGFRRQVARLAVLAAQRLVVGHPQPSLEVRGAYFREKSDRRIYAIVWPDEGGSPIRATARAIGGNTTRTGERAESDPARPLVVGNFPELGGVYQSRGFERAIHHKWSTGGDRRLWLRGGPGLGKSYAARRVMQDALDRRSADREMLLIWVDSANPQSVTHAFAHAAEQIPQLRAGRPADEECSELDRANALLAYFRTTDSQWLVVLDDADAHQLIEHRLIPTGTNPHGRVLITTLSAAHLLQHSGQVVEAELFSSSEAETFLTARLPEASPADRSALSQTTGHHPLALSIAAATIVANRMTVGDWITEFTATPSIDDAADSRDSGGYPNLIGATWRLALTRASRDLPTGLVERAALVVACQSTDGHPTWLWKRESIATWVGGTAPTTRVHPGIRALLDNGVVGLDGTWNDGRITIHQLAARAILELAGCDAVAEITLRLTDEWLLEMTRSGTDIALLETNLHSIDDLPALPAAVRDTIEAILGVRGAMSGDHLPEWVRHDLLELEPLLLQGGAVGQADLARRFAEIGWSDARLGKLDEAATNWRRGADILRAILRDPDSAGPLRPSWLKQLGEIEEALGLPEQARNHFSEAARSLGELASRTAGARDRSLNELTAVVELSQRLGDQESGNVALESLLGYAQSHPQLSAWELEKVGKQLAFANRAEGADFLSRAVEIFEATGLSDSAGTSRLVLARLHLNTGRWSDAVASLSGYDGGLVLLAGAQLHLGRVDEARASLARSAELARSAVAAQRAVPDELQDVVRRERPSILDFLTTRAVESDRWADAAALSRAALELRIRSDGFGDDQSELAEAYVRAGLVSSQADNLDEAIVQLTKGVDLQAMLSQLEPSDSSATARYIESLVLLAGATRKADRPELAVAQARKALALLEGSGLADGSDQKSLALYVIGQASLDLHQPDAAISALTQRHELIRRATETRSTPTAHASLANALTDTWRAMLGAERWQEAIEILEHTVSLRRTLVESGCQLESRRNLAVALLSLAYARGRIGEPDQTAVYEEVMELREQAFEADPVDLALQVDLAITAALYSGALSNVGRDAEAAAKLMRAVNLLELPTELDPSTHTSLQLQVLVELAATLRRLGRAEEAASIERRADDLKRRFPDSDV